MANTNSPFGFQHVGYLEGTHGSQGQMVRKIASGYGTAINTGDVVVSVSTGYIQLAAAGTTQIAGIFVGCKYLSSVTGKTEWSKNWPGSGATGDVEAYVINSPTAIFKVQVGGSTSAGITLANINENANFAVGTAANGISGAYLDQTTLNTTNTLPFRVIGLITDPPGANGTDSASAYNQVYVTFNNTDYKALTGI